MDHLDNFEVIYYICECLCDEIFREGCSFKYLWCLSDKSGNVALGLGDQF